MTVIEARAEKAIRKALLALNEHQHVRALADLAWAMLELIDAQSEAAEKEIRND